MPDVQGTVQSLRATARVGRRARRIEFENIMMNKGWVVNYPALGIPKLKRSRFEPVEEKMAIGKEKRGARAASDKK